MDEMDLVKQLKGVPPLRDEAYERARATLGAAMAEFETVRDTGWRKRFFWARNFRVGIAVIGATAAVVGVVSVTSAPQPSAPAGGAGQAPVVDSRLVTLAADVRASGGSLPGDASLVIRTQTISGKEPYVTYNLYTDAGEVYVTDTGEDLPGAIARHDNLADPMNARLVSVARQAATGDLDKAREDMVNVAPNAWGLGLSPAEAQRVWDEAEAELRQILEEKGVVNPPHRPRPTGKALEDGINNHLWTHSLEALTLGAANPEVRAGVLRLISTIPDVTVTYSTTAGQPSLVLTAGPALFDGYNEHVLTINADTALPIRSEMKPVPGQPLSETGPLSVETYQSSRVMVADIAAGNF